jgi:hypothetical protein
MNELFIQYCDDYGIPDNAREGFYDYSLDFISPPYDCGREMMELQLHLAWSFFEAQETITNAYSRVIRS